MMQEAAAEILKFRLLPLLPPAPEGDDDQADQAQVPVLSEQVKAPQNSSASSAPQIARMGRIPGL
ncbi:hypothetical protein [Azospirillum brasilense]|uniref:hypothetical protein n=1 Tax=Azospirillum brasilense TaxID=192 RepID=UPI000E69B9BE|nr:hypothetical protein [Azospirillum brasilense]NUB27218.1 hypothetical protein [Azospirillum brasilense]NUB30542.1 hypothetical protein [Azospirillum brasilense]RIW07770.1 hypothetical protein D2T81_02720 [Azospirillum brasilense]